MVSAVSALCTCQMHSRYSVSLMLPITLCHGLCRSIPLAFVSTCTDAAYTDAAHETFVHSTHPAILPNALQLQHDIDSIKLLPISLQ